MEHIHDTNQSHEDEGFTVTFIKASDLRDHLCWSAARLALVDQSVTEERSLSGQV